jgi:hypothetical protein
MNRGFQLLLAGLAGAVVLTAAFSPGRQTIGGIQALGTAGSRITASAEGR